MANSLRLLNHERMCSMKNQIMRVFGTIPLGENSHRNLSPVCNLCRVCGAVVDYELPTSPKQYGGDSRPRRMLHDFVIIAAAPRIGTHGLPFSVPEGGAQQAPLGSPLY